MLFRSKKGIFVLVKTSNPSSGEFQDRVIDGRPLYELVGEKVAQWGDELMGDGYSYVGAVVGATYPEMGKVLRKLMPKTFILVPGYGAQGAKIEDIASIVSERKNGVINVSRGYTANLPEHGDFRKELVKRAQDLAKELRVCFR